MQFESPYYTSLWCLLTGLTNNPKEHKINEVEVFQIAPNKYGVNTLSFYGYSPTHKTQ